MDGDGQTTCGGDCDDTDATLNGLDTDDDGVSSCAGDCDDTDAGKGDSAQDADCDGVKTDEDCDDTDGLLGTCWTTLSLGHEHSCRYAPLVKPIVGGIMVQTQTYPSTGSVPLAPVTTTLRYRHHRHTPVLGCQRSRSIQSSEGLYHAVSVGDGHSCAIDASGRMSCWGPISWVKRWLQKGYSQRFTPAQIIPAP